MGQRKDAKEDNNVETLARQKFTKHCYVVRRRENKNKWLVEVQLSKETQHVACFAIRRSFPAHEFRQELKCLEFLLQVTSPLNFNFNKLALIVHTGYEKGHCNEGLWIKISPFSFLMCMQSMIR